METYTEKIAPDVAVEFLKSIIAMAHGLRLRVVAEGVENERQFDFLRALNNDEYQGFLYSKPLSASDVERRFLVNAGGGAAVRSAADTAPPG